METIQLKTVDPVSQDLLRLAAKKTISLNWERYEKLQPQDGFLRLGLSCPYGCMQGPCRIDPFERGPEKGVCGIERKEMVAAMLLRLCLQGAMEAIQGLASAEMTPNVTFSNGLNQLVSGAMANLGNRQLSVSEVFYGASLLQRPAASYIELVRQALRLSLLSIGALDQTLKENSSGTLLCQAGYGLVAGNHLNIGLAGRLPREFIETLQQEAAGDSAGTVRMVSLGDWIALEDRYVPFVCTSGEAELLVSSGAIHLLIAGTDHDPGLTAVSEKMEVPVMKWDRGLAPKDVLERARHQHATASRKSPLSDSSLKGEGRVINSTQELVARFKENFSGRMVLIGGCDTLRQPFGYLPVELTVAFRGEGYQVGGWGDAALWMIKDGLASAQNDSPVHILPQQEGPLMALKALEAVGKRNNLSGICFTGLRDCLDFSNALGLAVLGCPVCLADPIPVWGSQAVRELLAEALKNNGGQLMHADHPVTAQEILEWLQ